MAGYKPIYTIDEEMKIIEYLIENNGIEKVKGNLIWQYMARDTGLKRSWQSLKDHFRRAMFKKLNFPQYNLTRAQQEQIRDIYENKKTNRSRINVSPTPRNAWYYMGSSSDEEASNRNQNSSPRSTTETENTGNSNIPKENTDSGASSFDESEASVQIIDKTEPIIEITDSSEDNSDESEILDN